MEQRKNHHNGSGGFLLGVIVGVLITLLFTTKKGREILRELTEKGLDKFSDLEKRIHREEDEFDTYEEEEENDYIKPDQPTRHLADANPVEVVEKKEAPAAHKPVEHKEQPKHTAAPTHHIEHKKIEQHEHHEIKHEAREQKEAPKKSGVRRFFKLKK